MKRWIKSYPRTHMIIFRLPYLLSSQSSRWRAKRHTSSESHHPKHNLRSKLSSACQCMSQVTPTKEKGDVVWVCEFVNCVIMVQVYTMALSNTRCHLAYIKEGKRQCHLFCIQFLHTPTQTLSIYLTINMPPNVTVEEITDSLHQGLDLAKLGKEQGRYLVYPDKKVRV